MKNKKLSKKRELINKTAVKPQNQCKDMNLIKKPHELNVQTTIKALLYGQPGLGKTTLSLSTPNPLLLDFDNGVHRVNASHKCDTVQIESYQNFLDVLKEDLSEYNTLIIDTAGKMLDYMGLHLIQNDPKLGKRDGSLSLQGYGARKSEFVRVLKAVSIMGKHIIFVAHEREEKEGDQKIIRPEIGGSSANDLMKELDLVGYMQAIGKDRTVSFDPCEKYYAKNTCNLPSIIKLPILIDTEGKIVSQNNQMELIFNSYKNYLEKQKKNASEYADLLDVISMKIELVTDEETANNAVSELQKLEQIWDSKLRASAMLKSKCVSIGLNFNTTTKKYEKI